LCAVSTAWHDWQAKVMGMPLFAHLTLPRPTALPTSVTVSVGDVRALRQWVETGYRHIKIKMDDDAETNRAVFDFIRQSSGVVFRIDANGSWSEETAATVLSEIPADKLELIEQPFAADRVDEWERFRSRCSVPVIMDESISSAEDVKRVAEFVDGVNVKLQKSGTLENAVAIIKEARAHKLKVMIGCMIESSVGIAAAYHFSGLADYIDLDGRLLVTRDSFTGLTYADGGLTIEGAFGHGVSAR
jgi:L-alanine-DL-glutamate epimerase-like enolase superfamily enzyme